MIEAGVSVVDIGEFVILSVPTAKAWGRPGTASQTVVATPPGQ